MGSNERLIAVGVLVVLAAWAGYNFHSGRYTPNGVVAQATNAAGR